MKRTATYFAVVAVLSLPLLASDSAGAPPGGGGGGGGGACERCDCKVTGTVGNKTCHCVASSWAGIDCKVTPYMPGWGNDCTAKNGPCKRAIAGFAP